MDDGETTRAATTTKTYIIDNGRAYSLHTVYFVEAASADFEPLWALWLNGWRLSSLASVRTSPTSRRRRLSSGWRGDGCLGFVNIGRWSLSCAARD